MVDVRGAELRKLGHEALQAQGKAPLEHVVVQGRPATIGVIVEPAADGAVRVVVQGFMKGRWFFSGSSVALHGFYKYSDGRVGVMPEREFNEFD